MPLLTAEKILVGIEPMTTLMGLLVVELLPKALSVLR